MSSLMIHVDLDSDAFAGEEVTYEVARILKSLANEIQHKARAELQDLRINLKDINGKRCGGARFLDVEDEDDHQEAIFAFIEDQDRPTLVRILEDLMSIQCFDEPPQVLAECIKSVVRQDKEWSLADFVEFVERIDTVGEQA